MALVFPAVARYVIEQTFLGRPAINILDMALTNEDGVSREQAVFNVAGDIINNWADHMMGLMAEGVSFNAVSWVDLNSEDGSTGRRTTTSDTSLPVIGGAAGDTAPASVAMLIRKQSVSRRGQRQGRWFIPGATEQNLNGNLLSSGFLTAVEGNLADFLAGVSDQSPILDVERIPVVLHTENQGTPQAPVIVATGWSQIQALSMDAQVASQRRRNRP